MKHDDLTSDRYRSHSAVVTLELRIAGKCVPLAQVAHNFAIPVEPIDLPAGEAEVVMTVDSVITRMPVFLRSGGQARSRRIELSGHESRTSN